MQPIFESCESTWMFGDSDEIEVLRSAKNDQAKWGKLLESHRRRLSGMIELRISPRLRGRVDASDIIQEAYVEATKRLDEYVANPRVPFYVWLRGLANQHLAIVCRKHFGAKQRAISREVPMFASQLPEASSVALAARLIGQWASPSAVAIQAEQQVRLQQALDSLDSIDREVLILRHFEELTNAEAAAVLELKPSAASNRYIRAIARLKAILTDAHNSSSEFSR